VAPIDNPFVDILNEFGNAAEDLVTEWAEHPDVEVVMAGYRRSNVSRSRRRL
jgi:hypothetical protein